MQRTPSQVVDVARTAPHTQTEFGFCIFENIYFLPCAEPPTENSQNHFFSIEDQFIYCPFARDFGPFNLGVVLRFCELMEEKREQFSTCKIILHCLREPEKCTNVAFLLGAFLVSNQHPRSSFYCPCCTMHCLLLFSFLELNQFDTDSGS